MSIKPMSPYKRWAIVFAVVIPVYALIYFGSKKVYKTGTQQSKTQSTETTTKKTIEKQISKNIEGKGDKVEVINLNKGVAIFTMAHFGSLNFSVVIKGSDGEHLDLLANDMGSYSGQKTFTVKESGIYLVEISASGKWTINIE